jgi:serine/threonine protein kinase
MENLLGKTIDRYQILNKLPEGGMGVVYGAFDNRLERSVAIKFIRTDKIAPSDLDHLLKRFEREAKVLARFDHTNIVTIYDYGEFQNQPYLVMQYLSGGSLKDLTGKKMPWGKALQITFEIANGLAYAHEAGILHRDIKPGNILMTQEGKIKITDFGIARILESGDNTQLTATGIGIGTPDYMSPEQCMGMDANPQSDVYALGVVLYELITGNKPFTADTPMAVMIKQVHDPLPDPRIYVPDLPEALHKLILKALAKDPADRYEDMHSFDLAIQELLAMELHPHDLQGTEKEKQQQTADYQQAATVVNLEEQNKSSTLIPAMDLETSVDLQPFNSDQQTEIMPVSEPGPEIVKQKRRPRRKWFVWIGIIAVLIISTFTLVFSGVLNPFINHNNMQKYTNPIDGMIQVYVKGGEFTMGSTNGKINEQPLHQVFVDSFWIDQYEVSNSQYASCVAAGFCERPPETKSILRMDYYDLPSYGNFPVIYVSWQDAKNYCSWSGKRLVTEAEWEKAARGSKSQDPYPWGKTVPGCNLANINNCYGDTNAVGSYSWGISSYGVYDMTGNVAEWVSDWYLIDAYSKTERTDPTGPEDGFKKVIRGGSWYTNPAGAELTRRDSNYPEYHGPQVGFRCAASID